MSSLLMTPLLFVCPVAATIIREHDGVIGVESSGIRGEGSLFYFELQTVDPAPSPPETKIEIPTLLPNESPENKFSSVLKPFDRLSSPHAQIYSVDDGDPSALLSSLTPLYHRALIVDDSHLVRKLLSKSLDNQFRLIDQASDGAEAVSLVTKLMQEGETINVIFLDSFMPNMGGIEACRLIRALGYRGVIIAISGNVIQEDIQEFLAAGADHFIGKPFKLDQLQALLSGQDTVSSSPISPSVHSSCCLLICLWW
jgi:CheY-like chemotaxis protein